MSETTSKTFAEVIEELTKRQKQAEKDWRDALAKYDDPTYDEEFEDTLQRKIDEGASDALKSALELLASFDYAKTIKEAEESEGRYVLDYLKDVFEGVDETDIWGEYFEQVSCGACGEFYTAGEDNQQTHWDECDENPSNMDDSAKPENHFHNPKAGE